MNSKCAMAEHGHWQTRFVGPCATALQWQGQVAVLLDDNTVRVCVREKDRAFGPRFLRKEADLHCSGATNPAPGFTAAC